MSPNSIFGVRGRSATIASDSEEKWRCGNGGYPPSAVDDLSTCEHRVPGQTATLVRSWERQRALGKSRHAGGALTANVGQFLAGGTRDGEHRRRFRCGAERAGNASDALSQPLAIASKKKDHSATLACHNKRQADPASGDHREAEQSWLQGHASGRLDVGAEHVRMRKNPIATKHLAVVDRDETDGMNS
jgi:hypothetical protein